jgi:ribosomal protein L11 methyltransferase
MRASTHSTHVCSWRVGGPEAITGTWPLVVANVLAAPLIEMAPTLARRVGHHGQLVLSGIRSAMEHDVAHAYRHIGMQHVRVTSRAGWIALRDAGVLVDRQPR